jgi:hypothetical protein
LYSPNTEIKIKGINALTSDLGLSLGGEEREREPVHTLGGLARVCLCLGNP